MRDIVVIFGIVFFIGMIFVIPNEIKSSKDEIKYSHNYLMKKSEVKKIDKISFNMDLRTKSKYSSKDYDKMLHGTNLHGLGSSFKQCDDIGINSLFIVALACHESNYGKSALSRDKNNIFGFMAYDRDPYNSAKAFSSKDECIQYVSKYILNNYLTENGKFFYGYTISDINVKYASDTSWSTKIYNIMQDLERKL